LIQQLHGETDEESVSLPETQTAAVLADEKKTPEPESSAPSIDQHDAYAANADKSLLPADAKRAFWLSTVIILIIAVVVPIPLGASTYIFSPGFFTAWIIVAMVRVSWSSGVYATS
jgi:urea-proton symporter